MKVHLFSAAVCSLLVGVTLSGSQAEARRLFWWQLEDRQFYDGYGDGFDSQDAYAEEQFNQDEYDRYMKKRHPRNRLRYDQSYYDPLIDEPGYRPVQPKSKKKKTAAVTKPVLPQSKVLSSKPPVSKPAVNQTASINKQFSAPVTGKSVDCSKGASIVAGFGFSDVTTKSCTGPTLTYTATRSSKNFEIQVSAGSGELIAVKKL